MLEIKEFNRHISYFNVPYKDIYVGIYVIKTAGGAVLFDTAANDADVDGYIVPALEQLGMKLTHVFISHNHGDHAGGLARVAELYPQAKIVSRSGKLQETYPGILAPEDGQMLTDELQVITIPGHTADSAALFDLRTNTLVTGDCLQSYGIYGSGYWYGAVTLTAQHYAAVRKLRALPIENIATAHDYYPVGQFSLGKDAVAARLDSCIGALERVRAIMDANPAMTDEEIAALCNDGRLPKVAARVLAGLRKAAAEGSI
jgi:glyoxylase-like metal-dependent hydrolase (beta-lactamase superfamily II)